MSLNWILVRFILALYTVFNRLNKTMDWKKRPRPFRTCVFYRHVSVLGVCRNSQPQRWTVVDRFRACMKSRSGPNLSFEYFIIIDPLGNISEDRLVWVFNTRRLNSVQNDPLNQNQHDSAVISVDHSKHSSVLYHSIFWHICTDR